MNEVITELKNLIQEFTTELNRIEAQQVMLEHVLTVLSQRLDAVKQEVSDGQ